MPKVRWDFCFLARQQITLPFFIPVRVAHSLLTLIKNDLVVRSSDRSSTLAFADSGALFRLVGLKLRTADMILLEMAGLVRTRADKAFSEASRSTASLFGLRQQDREKKKRLEGYSGCLLGALVEDVKHTI